MAHIYAHSPGGPRANPTMSLKERDSYENLSLLCDRHAAEIDKQPNSYPADRLVDLKRDHEGWVRSQLERAVIGVTFVELQYVTQAIISTPISPEPIDLRVVPPEDKMTRNGLGPKVGYLLRVGSALASDVATFLDQIAKFDIGFPQRLRTGFVNEYARLHAEGLRGDTLFFGLQDFAQAGRREFPEMAAGLSILVHLFHVCEVFER